MRRLDDPGVVGAFVERFQRLTTEHQRAWGSMHAHQMVSHVGDACEAVLKQRSFPSRTRGPSMLAKLLVIYVLPRFPRGVRTKANPAAKVLDTAAFAADRDRAVLLLRQLAAAADHSVADYHPIFGAMTRKEWMRWAYLHTDHHLRQFGL